MLELDRETFEMPLAQDEGLTTDREIFETSRVSR